jgi:Abnormal spindle-like microcephaly-assoc'd, ASPM-SPD-2-Hydin/Kelch motif/Galactose oxidase, central domain
VTKLFIATLAICCLFLAAPSLPAQIQGGWVNTGNMNATRESGTQVTLANGKALVAGGTDGANHLLASAEIYNPSTGAWTATGSMATARNAFAGVLLKSGKVLVVGGVGGGGTFLTSAELYDPATGKWSPAGKLSVARIYHTATLLQNGHVLVAGGCSANSCGPYTPVSELYDPNSNTWSTTTGSMITARASHTATLLANGEVLVVGGVGVTTLRFCELYNPSTGQWFNAASTFYARINHATTVLNSGKVLVTGGSAPRSSVRAAEIYDPVANTWTVTGSLIISRWSHTSTLLGDGTVLIAGGLVLGGCSRFGCSSTPTAASETYHESTGKFTATGSLNAIRYLHTTTLLGTGQALAAGGGNYYRAYNTAELYTPLTFTFSATSLNLGFEQVGVASPAQAVTVTNASLHSANITSITKTGDYAETNNCVGTLNPGKPCTIKVTFTPTTSGTRHGIVTLNDDAPGSPQQMIMLTGNGSPYAFAVSPTSLTFPSVLPGNSSGPLNVTVIGDGTGPVSIPSISISPADGIFTQTNNCPPALNPQQTCTVQIIFKPADSISYTETLLVTDSANNPLTVTLMGSGID